MPFRRLSLPMGGAGVDENSLSNSNTSNIGSPFHRRKKAATQLLAVCMMCCGYLAIPKAGSGLFSSFSSSSSAAGDVFRNLAVSIEKSVHTAADGTERSPFQTAQVLSEAMPAFRLGTGLHKASPEYRDATRDGDNTSRALSTWDGAACEWEPGEPITGDVFSTFIVGFPGSGKRLAWQLMEALSGAVSGDDWNHSLNNYNVAFMKGSFPQHESSVWLWGSEMDQSESISLRSCLLFFRSMLSYACTGLLLRAWIHLLTHKCCVSIHFIFCHFFNRQFLLPSTYLHRCPHAPPPRGCHPLLP